MCAGVAASGASRCFSHKSNDRRIVLPYVVLVLGAHAAESRARVVALSASEPRIMVMYGFIVSIHGLVLVVTVALYLGCALRPNRWFGILGSRCSPVKSDHVALTTPRLSR
jgi:hypothetical protein